MITKANMSKLFDLMSDDQIEAMNRRWEESINEAWELHEAEQDLIMGIQENRPLEFVSPESINHAGNRTDRRRETPAF